MTPREQGGNGRDWIADQTGSTIWSIDELRESSPSVVEFVLKMAGVMSPRYEAVLRGRLDGKTFKECGALIGVSTERARQMQEKALRKARSMERQWL